MKQRIIIVGILICISMVIGIFWYRTRIFSYVQQKFNQSSLGNHYVMKKLTKQEFFSKSLNQSTTYYIHTSPKLESTANVTVIYFFHGFPGNNMDWVFNTTLVKQFDNLYKQGKVSEYILVFPDFNGPKVEDSQYLNATKVEQPMENYFLEIKNDVESKGNSSQISSMLVGISSGAYGAVNISLRYPNLFDKVFSLSGYFINQEISRYDLIEDSDISNDPLKYLPDANIGTKTKYYLSIGKADDARFVAENKAMYDVMLKKGIKVELNLVDGAHGWPTWEKMLPNVLDQIISN
jgi:enterochelin esterase-like enzyme